MKDTIAPPKEVLKRNNEVQNFEPENITKAILKAAKEIDKDNSIDVVEVVDEVIGNVSINTINEETILTVDEIHKVVEDTLMDLKYFDIARAYIGYRKTHKPDIFKERLNYKPFEYPKLNEYVDAIQQSYWIVSEFNFSSDIQDYKSELTVEEKEAVKRSMLAISQVEVAVKNFWGKIVDRIPKPEIQEVGAVFAESEVRHSKAYAQLLEYLGLNSEFETVLEVPSIKKRVDYAQKALSKSKTDSNQDYLESVLLFSLFIENVSLFSQFLIISQMNKERAVLSGMSNVISATSLEENLHSDFGSEVVNVIRTEHPEWFTDDLTERIQRLVWQAFEAEKAIVDWIFEEGDLPYLSKNEVIEYIKNRFNSGLEQSGFNKVFQIDETLLENTRWFDVQNNVTMHTDFFAKRPVNYTKFSQSFSEDDLF